jgi:hypothetical protein
VSWEERLFGVLDDLEQQAEAMYDAERALDLADRSRSEYAAVVLEARLMASVDRTVSLEVRGVGRVAGTLQRVARGWCLVGGPRQDWIVVSPAILTITGASERAVPEVAWPAVARLGLGSALRRLADAGERAVVHLVDGATHDVVPTRVGQDFLEAVSPGGEAVLLAFDGIAAVRGEGH